MAELISINKFDSSPPRKEWTLRSLETADLVISEKDQSAEASWQLPIGTLPQLSIVDGNLSDVVVQDTSFDAPRHPVTLAWKDITLTTKEGKRILKGVSGKVSTGQLTAIMGPSGAGKSTLLNVLSGFTNQKVTGKILVNGVEKDNRVYRKLSVYIMQDDHLLPHLTVKETVHLAAALKIPNHVPKQQRQNAVQDSIRSLGLEHVQDNKAVNLSGGQRKRLCIAQELVSNPPLIFLDEPTSGLDSSSCLQCISLLKSLAQEGRTVICTIHQPSATIFEIFDKLYMLAAGQCIYRGPTACLTTFLADQGLVCPKYHNPTDFIMEVAIGDRGDWVPKLKEAVEYAALEDDDTVLESPTRTSSKLDSEVLQASTLCLLEDKPEKHSITLADVLDKSYRGFATSSLNQFKILTYRSVICTLREPMATQLRLFAHIVVGILLGMLYFGIGDDASKIFNNSGFLFFSLLFLIFTAMMPTVLTFPMERTIFAREHLNSWYSTKMYYLAKTVAEIPFQIVFPIIYCSIVYWMTQQPNELIRFGLFILSSIMISLVAQSVGLLIGASTSVQNAVFLAPVVSIPILLFSGFFISLNTIPSYLQWLSYISYIRYSYQSVLLAIYSMDRPELECTKMFCPFSEPADFLKDMDMLGSDIYVDYAAQFAFFIVFRIAGYFVLKYRIRNNSR